MLCTNPPKSPAGASLGWPCGKCVTCRINKKRQWQTRLMLEWFAMGQGVFITLTYRDADLPEKGHLVPEHLTKFMKRLRKAHGEGIRFHAVGEYGELNCRPHYHVSLFGKVLSQAEVETLWPYGFVHVGIISSSSLAYVVGYCLKKLSRRSSSLPDGLPPEFFRSSRMGAGGLGASAIPVVAACLKKNEAVLNEIDVVGVPREIRMEGMVFPLDRYLRGKLQDALQGEVDFSDKFANAYRTLVYSMQKPLLSAEELEKRRREAAGRAMRRINRYHRSKKL